jgi:hypothetical protein
MLGVSNITVHPLKNVAKQIINGTINAITSTSFHLFVARLVSALGVDGRWLEQFVQKKSQQHVCNGARFHVTRWPHVAC